jgi:hypothetical protein
MTIDAKPDDWHDTAMTLSDSNLYAGATDGPDDLRGSLRLAWDRAHLYFYLQVTDDELSAPHADAWRQLDNDGMPFAFDAFLSGRQEMNGGRKYDDLLYGLSESPDGIRPQQYLWTGDVRTLDVEVAHRRQGTQRTYEFAIPWSDLSPVSPEFLQQTGFGFSLTDHDVDASAGKLGWAPGRLRFQPPDEPVTSSLALPPEWNVVDRGSRFLHLPAIDANGTATLLVRSPTQRIVKGRIRVDRDIELKSAHTLSAWVQLEGSEHVSWQFIISRMWRSSELREGAWSLRFSRNRLFFRDLYCCVEDGRWAMVSATYSDPQVRVYVDGELVQEYDAPPIIQEDDLPICIACTQGNSLPPFQYFKGAIDEIRVYNRALSALEIGELYKTR